MTDTLATPEAAYVRAFQKARDGFPLTRADMMTLYGYKHAAWNLHRHEFDRFKVKPSNGLYAGALVYQHLTTQPDHPRDEFTFGRKTFGSKRRA